MTRFPLLIWTTCSTVLILHIGCKENTHIVGSAIDGGVGGQGNPSDAWSAGSGGVAGDASAGTAGSGGRLVGSGGTAPNVGGASGGTVANITGGSPGGATSNDGAAGADAPAGRTGGTADSGATGGGSGGMDTRTGGTRFDAGVGGTGGVHADAATDAPLPFDGSADARTVTSTDGSSRSDSVPLAVDGKALSCSAIPGPCSRVSTSSTSLPGTTNYIYNDKGQLIREESTQGDYVSTWYYAYDQAGNRIERKNDACLQSGSNSCFWEQYTFDGQGHMIESNDVKTTASMPLGVGCWHYEYNSNGLVVRSYFLSGCSDQSPVQRATTYDYDSAGRQSAVHGYGAQVFGEVGVDGVFKYDGANQLVLETYTDKQGSVVGTIAYTRDSNGNALTEELHHVATSDPDYRFTWTYDEKGNKLTQRRLALTGKTAGQESNCQSNTYDRCGNPLTETGDGTCDGTAASLNTYSYACFEGQP
jgi:YD repeat-containing protein